MMKTTEESSLQWWLWPAATHTLAADFDDDHQSQQKADRWTMVVRTTRGFTPPVVTKLTSSVSHTLPVNNDGDNNDDGHRSQLVADRSTMVMLTREESHSHSGLNAC